MAVARTDFWVKGFTGMHGLVAPERAGVARYHLHSRDRQKPPAVKEAQQALRCLVVEQRLVDKVCKVGRAATPGSQHDEVTRLPGAWNCQRNESGGDIGAEVKGQVVRLAAFPCKTTQNLARPGAKRLYPARKSSPGGSGRPGSQKDQQRRSRNGGLSNESPHPHGLRRQPRPRRRCAGVPARTHPQRGIVPKPLRFMSASTGAGSTVSMKACALRGDSVGVHQSPWQG